MRHFLPVLDLCITDQCNLSCVQCNHFTPYLKKQVVDLQDIENDLMCLHGSFLIGELRLIGGEPLLHRDLMTILDMIKKIRITDQITIITNGVLIDTLPDAVWKRINRLWISLYPDVSDVIDKKKLRKKAEQYDVQIWLRNTAQFRIISINRLNQNVRQVDRIYRNCRMGHGWGCAQIRSGYIYKCPIARYISQKLHFLGLTLPVPENDGFSIHENMDLVGGLTRYLNDKKPLNACHYCLGTMGKKVRHRLMGDDGRKGELLEDHSDIASLMSPQEYWISKIMVSLSKLKIVHVFKNKMRYR